MITVWRSVQWACFSKRRLAPLRFSRVLERERFQALGAIALLGATIVLGHLALGCDSNATKSTPTATTRATVQFHLKELASGAQLSSARDYVAARMEFADKQVENLARGRLDGVVCVWALAERWMPYTGPASVTIAFLSQREGDVEVRLKLPDTQDRILRALPRRLDDDSLVRFILLVIDVPTPCDRPTSDFSKLRPDIPVVSLDRAWDIGDLQVSIDESAAVPFVEHGEWHTHSFSSAVDQSVHDLFQRSEFAEFADAIWQRACAYKLSEEQCCSAPLYARIEDRGELYLRMWWLEPAFRSRQIELLDESGVVTARWQLEWPARKQLSMPIPTLMRNARQKIGPGQYIPANARVRIVDADGTGCGAPIPVGGASSACDDGEAARAELPG